MEKWQKKGLSAAFSITRRPFLIPAALAGAGVCAAVNVRFSWLYDYLPARAAPLYYIILLFLKNNIYNSNMRAVVTAAVKVVMRAAV